MQSEREQTLGQLNLKKKSQQKVIMITLRLTIIHVYMCVCVQTIREAELHLVEVTVYKGAIERAKASITTHYTSADGHHHPILKFSPNLPQFFLITVLTWHSSVLS